MINNKRISVIIPAYNEASRIAETLENLNEKWIDEIIVVNDGSTDETAEIIKKYPVRLIDLKKNQGKGRAISEGIRHSTGDILVMVDADLGSSVKEIIKLVTPLLQEGLEVVIGIVPIRGGGRGFVRKVADLGLRFSTGKRMRQLIRAESFPKRGAGIPLAFPGGVCPGNGDEYPDTEK